MNGKGHIVYADGSTYGGDFKNGNLHGLGVFMYPDGAFIEGSWENGEFIEDVTDKAPK